MLRLRELQARFLRSIATTPERSDVHRFDPALLELVEGRGRLGSPERLGVYAEMYWARLLDVLRDDFPRVAAVLGGDRFTALAGTYLERHPSTHPSVRWVGAHFADFLSQRGPVDEQPFLADLARLEWTRLAVFDAVDAVPLRLEALWVIPPSTWPRLTFRPVPALRVLRCAWPVHELGPRTTRRRRRPGCARRRRCCECGGRTSPCTRHQWIRWSTWRSGSCWPVRPSA